MRNILQRTKSVNLLFYFGYYQLIQLCISNLLVDIEVGSAPRSIRFFASEFLNFHLDCQPGSQSGARFLDIAIYVVFEHR